MSNELEERERKADDDVVSTSAAGELMHMTRQGVDKGVRQGRIPGFRDPITSRMWVQRDWLLDQLPGGRLLDRVEEVEAHLRALERQNLALREEVTTTKSVNLQLLAAAGERDKADALLDRAAELEEEAKTKRRKAARRARKAAAMYRDAISATQVPGSPDGLEP